MYLLLVVYMYVCSHALATHVYLFIMPIKKGADETETDEKKMMKMILESLEEN